MLIVEKLNNQQLHKFKELQEDDLEGYFEAGEPRPLIPEGNYKARVIGYKKKNYRWGEKIEFKFQIDEPCEYKGIELSMYMNVYKKYNPASTYYEAWVIAKGSKPPRKDKMTPRIFLGGLFEVIVTTVKPKHKDGSYKKEILHYSKIDEIKDRIIGQ